MAVKHSIEEIFELDEEYVPSYDVLADGVTLDFQMEILNSLKDAGITQKELATRIGISAPTLSSMLKLGANLTIKTMCRLAHGLGFTISSPKLVPLSHAESYSSLNTEKSNVAEAKASMASDVVSASAYSNLMS